MKIPKEAEVIVVGGGLVGCSVAYHLAKASKEVIVLEARGIASGASGRNGGMVVQLDGRDVNVGIMKEKLRYAKENIRLLDDLQKELACDFEYERMGSLDFAFSKEEWESLKKLVNLQRESGDEEIELLDKSQTKEMMPIISDKVFGARYRATDGRINPFKLIFAVVEAGKGYGVRFLTETKVEEIVVQNQKIKGVKVLGGKMIKSRWVVNATNAWASSLTKEAQVIPIREIAMITETLAPLRVQPFEAYVGKLLNSKEESHAWGTTQHADGNVCIGGPGLTTDHFYERVTLSEVVNTANIMRLMFPFLKEVSIIRCWAGTMAFTPDYNPLLGPVPDKDGLVIIAGINNGMGLGPILSKLGAEYIIYGETSLPINILDPKRFLEHPIKIPPTYTYAGMQKFLAGLKRE